MSLKPHTKRKSLKQLLEGFGVADVPDLEIADLTLDSRAATTDSLFIALAGQKTHGLAFAAQAIANGASLILYEPAPNLEPPPYAQAIAVPNLRALLGTLADRFFDSPSASMQVIGVTGTNGKTTSAYLLPEALAVLGRSAGYAGTLGFGRIGALKESAHTTADCISVHRQLASMRDDGDRAVGMEVSSHALDQNRVDGVRFHSALFTNLTRDHLDYHGTFEAYGAAKERLFHVPGLKHAAIHVGDAFGRQMTLRLVQGSNRAPVTAFWIGRESGGLGDRQLFATKVATSAAGLQLDVNGSWGGAQLTSPLIGAFNAENLLGVLAILLGLDIPLKDAVAALATCQAPPGRMETVTAPGQPLAVIDYAHTPDALSKALQTVRAHTNGRLICVFGCGGDRDAGKRPIMGEIAEQLADVVILTDDNPRMEDGAEIVADILQGFARPKAVTVERDRAKAIARALSMGTSEDIVLIAGKGHENYQIVGRNVKHFSDRETARKCLGLAP